MSIYTKIKFEKDEATVAWVEKSKIPIDLALLTKSDLEFYSKINNQNRKLEFYGVRWLLDKLLPNTYISYTETKKPILNIEKEISISHSGDIVSIALTSNQFCGIDVQELTEQTIRLRSKFLNEPELKLIDDSNLIENNLAWSAKETLFKMISEENMPFKASFHIDQIKEDKISTRVTHSKYDGEFKLHYTIFDTFVMVYYIG